MKPLTIGEVARRTGIRTSALRYYEEAGILPTPARLNGRRCYDAAAIRRVHVLRFAQQAGFRLREIKVLFDGSDVDSPLSERWQVLSRAKLTELDRLSERIRKMRRALRISLECRCTGVEDCSLLPKC